MKALSIFIISLLFLSTILTQSVVANEVSKDEDKGWKFPIMSRLIGMFFPLMRFQTDKVMVIPEKIEIGYGETVEVEVGLVDMLAEDQSYFTVIDDQPSFIAQRWFEFRAEYNDIEEKGFFASFDPSLVYIEVGKVVKTKMKISLNNPSGPPVQSGIIKINITDVWVYGNVWTKEGFKNWVPGRKLGWFFASTITVGFGKLSGKVLPEYMEFDLLVNVKPHKQAEIEALNIVKLRPNEITSIPIIVKNLGNYKDQFGFRLKGNFGDIKVIDPVTVTLEPGQSGNTMLGISVPDHLRDAGTAYPVEIQVYSMENPNVTIATQKMMLETQGLYVSEISAFLIGLFILVVIISFFFVGIIAKKLPKIEKKPKTKKPKAKDKKIKKVEEKKSVFSNLLKKREEKRIVTKEKPIKKPEKKSILSNLLKKQAPKEKPVKKVEKIKEIPIIEKKVDFEQKRKEEAIQRIKRLQEEQRKKFL